MSRLYANNYTSTIASALTDVATSIVVTSSTGLPTITGSDYYNLTLVAGGAVEIVKVTARSGTTLTVVRAQESTTAQAWDAGTIISLRPTAASFSSAAVGPGSSTDNAVARWDGTSGNTLQNSVVTIDDTGIVAGIASITVGTTTVATDDKVLLNDTSASDATKTATAQAIANLAKAASTTDNAVARYDGTTGDFQNSGVIIDDSNNVSGVARLDVDNVRIDGNTISSTDTNGNINILPDGTGAVVIGGNSTGPADLRLMEDSDNGTNYTGFKAPSSLAGNVIYTMPSADGTADYVLKTNGSGTLSWTAQTGGGVSDVTSSIFFLMGA